jgi:CheY-like chemotaxis protein
VQPLIAERGHQLHLSVDTQSIRVFGDPLRLTQALGNVLSNAAKYTENGGQISLAAQQVDDTVEIRVRDTGIGIPADMQPMIFDMFTQLNNQTGRAQGGLGIGLALVRRLLEMHGGSVSAFSEGNGEGSEFLITLPVITSEITAGNGRATVGLDSKTGAGPVQVRRRILVADDNSDALESLATLLELGGHEVFSAANGALALESAERNLPEVALLDIGMPKLDGYEVARRIRAQPWGRRITLVALTGWGQESDRRRSGEAGFDSHLVKPLDLDKLTALLERLPVAVSHGQGADTTAGSSVA